MKQSTFDFFISKTVSNEYLHFCLIIFEYLCFIFPSTVDAAMKLNHYNSTKTHFIANTTDVYSIMISKYLHHNNNTLCPLIIAILSVIFLIVYEVLNWFGTLENKCFKGIEWFIANAYNIVLFRYFSTLILDSSLMLFIYYSKEGTQSQKILSVFFFLLCLVFLIINYSFIIECSVIMNISNPQLVDKPKQYPYDQLSKQYEVIMFFIKFLTAMEYNYFQHSDKITLVIISINAMIVILSFILCFWLFIINSYFYWGFASYFANVRHNSLKKGISVFNCLYIFIGLAIFKKDTTIVSLLILSILSVNVTFIILFFDYYLSKKHHVSHCILSYEIILLMLISDCSQQSVAIRIKRLQDSTMRNHQMNCNYKKDKSDVECILCQKYSFNIKDNIRIFYHYLKKHQKTTKQTSDPFYEELSKLFYYKINKKPFKFYHYYYVLIYKYDNINKLYSRNASIIANIWFQENNDNHLELVRYLLKVNQTEDKTKVLLGNLRTFFTENISLKKPETSITLSSDLASAIVDTKELMNHSTHLSLLLSQLDSNSKAINETLHYNIIILRFILEALTNQSLNSFSPLNIEYLEDYLYLHYESDKVLVCSIYLSSIFSQDIKIIKACGIIVDYDNSNALLSDYFPKDIVKEGVEQFKTQISFDSCTKSQLKSFSFSFPFIKKGLIDYVKYNFKMIKMPNSSYMYIFGNYVEIKKRTILLNLNHPKIIILEVCKVFLNLIHFKQQWLAILKELNVMLYLHSIFETITTKDNENTIECELNNRYYIDNIKAIFNELDTLIDFKTNPNDKNEVNFMSLLEEIKKKKGDPIKITFERIIEYKKGIGLYEILLNNKSLQISNIMQTKINNNLDDVTEENENYNPKENNFGDNFQSSLSVSSLAKEISSSSTKTKDNAKSTSLSLNDLGLKKKISKNRKQLSFFTIVMLGLNILLIIVCFIFLFTQIYQTTRLSSLSLLYFHFKGLRWTIVNSLMSLLATICYSSTAMQTDKCINGYQIYTEVFQKKYGMPTEFSFLEYASYELQFKAEFALETLNEFRKLQFDSQDLLLQGLMENTISYYVFLENRDSNYLITQNITFEQGLRRYINSFFLLTNSLSENVSYVNVPIYFIKFQDGEYVFANSTLKNFSPIQKEIYKLLTNYLNFFSSFSIGGSSISSLFDSEARTNFIMMISFMVAIGIFNGILCLICKSNINTAYNIFKVLIYNIVYQTETIQNAIALKSKMDYLILLVKFYKKNPNNLIKKIGKVKYQTQHKFNRQPNKQIDDHSKDNDDDAKDIRVKASFGPFYYFLLGNLIKLLVITFGLFFSIVIIFDCYLVTYFFYILDLYKYVLLTYTSDYCLVTNLALASLSNIVNITDSDLAVMIGSEAETENILDVMIKENLKQYNDLLQYTNLNSSDYPLLEHHYSYTYEKLFQSMNEIFTSKVSDALNKDYRIVEDFVSKSFELLNVPNLNYVRGDISCRTIEGLHKKQQKNYAALYEYVNDLKLYRLYTIGIIFFRPISNTLKETILLPKLITSFNVYINIVISYLIVNICLEIILFIAVRWGISKTITRIQTNLYLLNNCV